jgi:predicted CXXCH cytochrome family protein
MTHRGKMLGMSVLLLWSTDLASAQMPSMQPDSARDCAVCHLSWVDSFNRPDRTPLIDKPTGPNLVDEQACLGCHDGSVADSRRLVWLEHGHQTGIKPSADMQVPTELPLEEGEITCRTCHTAHAGTGRQTLAEAVFLRMPNDASQLCQACHIDHVKGPELGTHPVGGMPWPVPDELIAAGAKVGPHQQRLICQTCHLAHGSHEDHLLVMGTETGELCQTCHHKLRPGLWQHDAAREHPQNPPLSTDTQRMAIQKMGTKVGPGETLICLSCHKLHHGLSGRRMLADTLADSQICVNCHPDRATMFETDHDLRHSAPNERNRLGQTPEVSGPCGACHSFHQYARQPDPRPLDQTGLCTTCHQQGQCAEKATGMPFSHPAKIDAETATGISTVPLFDVAADSTKRSLGCLSCHDPHETRHGFFLRASSDTLCGECHTDKLNALSGPHDFTKRPDLKNARGFTAEQSGKCGFCHGIHDAPQPALWRATAETPKTLDDRCVTCHVAGGKTGTERASELRHPSGPLTRGKVGRTDGQMPLFDELGEEAKGGFVACASCHDLHAGDVGPDHLLRQVDGEGTVCLDCHRETYAIGTTMHSEKVLSEHFDETRLCSPCHAAHARPGMPAEGMWAGPVGPRDHYDDVRRCTGCHAEGGAGRAITPIDHPEVSYHEPSDSAIRGFLPLVYEKEETENAGRIGCITCHLPHGSVGASPGDTERQIRSRKPMIRPYVAPNLCTSCHGFEGLLRFLYFHHPAKRRAADLIPPVPAEPTRPVPAAGRRSDSSSTEKLP